MKHPFMVTWIDEKGKRHSSSFRSANQRDRMATALFDRNLDVWISDQLQLVIEDSLQVSSTYDPRYEIPF